MATDKLQRPKVDRQPTIDVSHPSAGGNLAQKPTVRASITAHPMALAVVAGIFALLGALVPIIFSPSKVGGSGTDVVALQGTIDRLLDENGALKRDLADLRAPKGIRETFIIPENNTAIILERTYLATVHQIAAGVAKMSFNSAVSTSDDVEYVYLKKGGRINLASKANHCTVVMEDVLGRAVNVSTECFPAE